MTRAFRVRLLVFTLVTIAVASFLVLSASAALSRIALLQKRSEMVEKESFKIAEVFLQKIRELDHTVFQYLVGHDPRAWERFQALEPELDRWIDEQTEKAAAEAPWSEKDASEMRVMEQLNRDYDAYREVTQKAVEAAGTDTENPMALWERFESQADHMRSLGNDLMNAQRRSMERDMASSRRALAQVRWVTFGGLLLLLGSGGWLAYLVYRGLIAPLQERLLEAQDLAERREKLASLGVLAAGVAHEIRNPLTAIRARVFTLQRRMGPAGEGRGDVGVIDREIDRLERIVSDFLLFARPLDPVRVVRSAAELLREAQAFLQPALEAQGVRLEVESGPDLLVELDPAQMKQVLINLVRNGAEATGPGGRVTLRARADTRTLGGASRPVVVLEVEDNGRGMPPEVQKRLFDPFFSTKEAGTGLGLSIASRIVERHGGALHYRTQPGRGTTFGIVLPRMHSREATPPPAG